MKIKYSTLMVCLGAIVVSGCCKKEEIEHKKEELKHKVKGAVAGAKRKLEDQRKKEQIKEGIARVKKKAADKAKKSMH